MLAPGHVATCGHVRARACLYVLVSMCLALLYRDMHEPLLCPRLYVLAPMCLPLLCPCLNVLASPLLSTCLPFICPRPSSSLPLLYIYTYI